MPRCGTRTIDGSFVGGRAGGHAACEAMARSHYETFPVAHICCRGRAAECRALYALRGARRHRRRRARRCQDGGNCRMATSPDGRSDGGPADGGRSRGRAGRAGRAGRPGECRRRDRASIRTLDLPMGGSTISSARRSGYHDDRTLRGRGMITVAVGQSVGRIWYCASRLSRRGADRSWKRSARPFIDDFWKDSVGLAPAALRPRGGD